jgi:hypothetical protein
LLPKRLNTVLLVDKNSPSSRSYFIKFFIKNILCSQAQADERAAILKEQLEVRRQAVFDRVQREAKAEAKQNEVSNLVCT